MATNGFLTKLLRGNSVERGIIVSYYGELSEDLKPNRTMCFKNYDHVYSAEDICYNVAKALEIATPAYPLFAIAEKDNDEFQWLNPEEKIKCTHSAKHFWFRVRFIPSKNGLSTLKRDSCKKVISYLFHQMRDDFISNRVVYNKDISEEEALSKSLGLAVIDKVIYGKEMNMNYNSLQKFKSLHFIPDKYKGRFDGIIGSMKLENNFKPIVEEEYNKYKERSDIFVKGVYIEALMSYCDNYGSEEFRFNSGSDDEALVVVQPYDQNYPGFRMMKANDRDKKSFYHSRIEDLMDVSINELPERPTKIIHINRKQGQPFTLICDDYKKALSFVSLLDGYFRLMCDYTHSLCSLVETKFVKDLKVLKCYGPVRKEWARDRLVEKNRADPKRNFLLKLSRERLGNYTLVRLNSKGAEYFARITQDPVSKKYHVLSSDNLSPPPDTKTPHFESLQLLLEHYRQPPPVGFGLNAAVVPLSPFDNDIYLCGSKHRDEETSTSREQKKAGVSLISSIKLQHKIGEGRYTEVHKSHFENQDVAVKMLKSMPHHNSSEDLKHFCTLIHRSSFLDPSNTIISILGVRLLHPVSMVMEYAPFGDLGSFLREKKKCIVPMQIHSAAEQMAQALYHLQEVIGEVHGNIRCRNILVFKYEEGKVLLVKLADPGMFPFFGSYPGESNPWLAPECRKLKALPTLESDRYSYGTTLWEMYSFGQIPDTFEFQNFGFNLPQPEGCPTEMYSIMQQCWDHQPDHRISIKDIVRDIRQFINKGGGVYNIYADPTIKKVTTNGRASTNRGAVPGTGQLNSCDSETFLIQSGLSDTNSPSANSHESGNTVATMVDPRFGDFGYDNNFHDGEILKHQLKVNFSDKPLGQGHYGEVFRGEFTGYDGKVIPVAVKCLKKSMYYKYSKEFEKEFKIMELLRHENIVGVIGRCVEQFEESPQVLVLEYVENGCLRDFLKRSKDTLSLRNLLKFGYEIAQGMLYLATQKIVHRDLAARNILVTYDLKMKIADFGLSRALSPDRDYYRSDGNKELPAPWCAPESLLHQQFTEKTDVWSYGVTFWEILSYGSSPQFCEVRDLVLTLHKGHRLPRPKDCPECVYDFIIHHCWEYSEENRTDFRTIVKDFEGLFKHIGC